MSLLKTEYPSVYLVTELKVDLIAHDIKDYSKNIPYTGWSTLIYRGVIKDKSINMLIREIDAQEHELTYVKSKLPEYWK